VLISRVGGILSQAVTSGCALNHWVVFGRYPKIMLTPRQIDLVQDTFAAVVPITERAAADFYHRLFAMAPETRSLFRTDMAEQGRKLFLTLATVVDALDRLDTIVPVARELAIRHVAYGARDHHYEAVGLALIETLRNGLGESFDAEIEAAWVAAYRILSDTMLAAVHEHA
jgi:nitric oxide dioxygenase